MAFRVDDTCMYFSLLVWYFDIYQKKNRQNAGGLRRKEIQLLGLKMQCVP